MDSDLIVSSFAKEPSQGRQNMLLELTKAFHPSDWWYMDSLVLRRTGLRFDIVSNLPIELAMSVLQYLPPVDLCRARRVSRKWQAILTSEAVCHSSALRWFGDEFMQAVTGPKRAELSTHRQTFDHVASRKYLFSQGKPSSAYMLPLYLVAVTETWGHAMDIDNFAYTEGKFAFAACGTIHLSHVDKHLNYHWKLNVPNRERVQHIVLTDEILAVTTLSRRCLAWDITLAPLEFPLKRFPLQNNAQICLLAEKSTVLLYEMDGSIITWDTQTDKVRTLDHFVTGSDHMIQYAPGDSDIVVRPYGLHLHKSHLFFRRRIDDSSILVGKVSLETGQITLLNRLDVPYKDTLWRPRKASPTTLALFSHRKVEVIGPKEDRISLFSEPAVTELMTKVNVYHMEFLENDTPSPLMKTYIHKTYFINLKTDAIFDRTIHLELDASTQINYRYWRNMLILLTFHRSGKFSRVHFYNTETGKLAPRYFHFPPPSRSDIQLAVPPSIWNLDDDYLVVDLDKNHSRYFVVFKWGDWKGDVVPEIPEEYMNSEFSCKQCEDTKKKDYRGNGIVELRSHKYSEDVWPRI